MRSKGRPEERRSLVRAYGLRPELLAVTQVWQHDGDGFIVAAKGAPEAIASLCRASADEHARRESVSGRDGGRRPARAWCCPGARSAAESYRKTRAALRFEYLGLVGIGRSAARQRAAMRWPSAGRPASAS